MKSIFVISIFLAFSLTYAEKVEDEEIGEAWAEKTLIGDIKYRVSTEEEQEKHFGNFHEIFHNLNQHHLEKVKNDTEFEIFCPSINNVTFNTDHPWDVLGLPQCLAELYGKDALEGKLFMSMDLTDYCQLDLVNLPNKQTVDCFDKLKRRSPAINKV